jgi:hypothetical protein
VTSSRTHIGVFLKRYICRTTSLLPTCTQPRPASSASHTVASSQQRSSTVHHRPLRYYPTADGAAAANPPAASAYSSMGDGSLILLLARPYQAPLRQPSLPSPCSTAQSPRTAFCTINLDPLAHKWFLLTANLTLCA